MDFDDAPGAERADLPLGIEGKRCHHLSAAEDVTSGEKAECRTHFLYSQKTDQRPISPIGWSFATIFGILCWIGLAWFAGLLP